MSGDHESSIEGIEGTGTGNFGAGVVAGALIFVTVKLALRKYYNNEQDYQVMTQSGDYEDEI